MTTNDPREFIVSGGRNAAQVRYPWLGWDAPPYAHRSFNCGSGEPTITGSPARPREIVTHGDCGRKCLYSASFPHPDDYTLSLLDQTNTGRPMNDNGRLIEHYDDGTTFSGGPKRFHRMWSLLVDTFVDTDAVVMGPYVRGAWQYGGDTYTLYDLFRCHRIFIYKNITHDGTQYDDSTLRNSPTYKLRPKASSQPDSDVRFEPWSWGMAALNYERYYGRNGDNSDITPPPGVTFPTNYPITNQADIEANLSGHAILCGFLGDEGFYDHQQEAQIVGASFLDLVPAGENHHLILEMNVHWWRLRKQTICEEDHGQPTPYKFVCHNELVDEGFYNIYGRALVVI